MAGKALLTLGSSRMPGTSSVGSVFGPFTLIGEQRHLLLNGNPVEMAIEQLAILAALVDQAPQGVGATDLLACLDPCRRDGGSLWSAVSEINALLKTGSSAHYVAQTGPAKYQFMGLLERHAVGGQGNNPPVPGKGWLALHEQTTVVGRAVAIDRVRAQVSAARLVTVTGAGGMGKTTVALAVASCLGAAFAHGAVLVDLAPLVTAEALPQAVAVGMGIGVGEPDPLQALKNFLSGRQVLLVLDNCEHLIAAVACLAEQLLVAPALHILCTSREPLRARGEHVYQLEPMEVPPSLDEISAQEAAGYGAVQMFLQSTRNGSGGFRLSDGNAAAVSAICRRLDGIPLALELAAVHVCSLGVEHLAMQLHDTVLTLPVAGRSLEDRHRTLEATLDWSYSLLDIEEQAVMRRVSVFRSTFPLDSAVRVAADEKMGKHCVVDALLRLAAKSLVHTAGNGDAPQYRLLETTRVYAACKLQAAPELAATRLRYTDDCCERLQRAEALWEFMPAPAWMLRHGPLIQDARCGLDWAVGEPGTERLALRLLLASLALAGRMSLLKEYSERIGKGLDRLRASGDSDLELELQLTSALTGLMLHQSLPRQVIEDVGDRVQKLAEKRGDGQFDAVTGTAQWLSSIMRGDYPQASVAAKRQLAWAKARGDATLVHDAQRQMTYCLHYTGHQAGAASGAMEMLALPHSQRRVHVHTVNQIDPRVAMRIVLSRTQWLTGRSDTALDTIQEAIDLAESDRPTALCQALAFGGCQIALWNGEHQLAAQWTGWLDRFAAASKLPLYQQWAAHFATVLEVRNGRGAPLAQQAPLTPMQWDAFATLDPLWAGGEAYARVEQGLVGWCAPEVVRATGERLLRGDGPVERAEHQILRALHLAREQGVISWELRAATSLAQLVQAQGAMARAREILEPVYLKFGEGLQTRDLRTAREVLLQAGS